MKRRVTAATQLDGRKEDLPNMASSYYSGYQQTDSHKSIAADYVVTGTHDTWERDFRSAVTESGRIDSFKDIFSIGHIRGTSGADHNVLPQSDGPDVMIGGDGNDDLHGLGGYDILIGAGGNDYLYGEGHNDLLVGGEGHDVLMGGDGSDQLFGGNGNDILIDSEVNLSTGEFKLHYDGDTSDVLNGGAGNDGLMVVTFDNDRDYMIGGSGDDTFAIVVGKVQGALLSNTDIIVDFQNGHDVISFHDLLLGEFFVDSFSDLKILDVNGDSYIFKSADNMPLVIVQKAAGLLDASDFTFT